MAYDANNILVGANGSVWVAPVGTPIPAALLTEPADPWIDLGAISEAGATFRDAKTFTPINIWQSSSAARQMETGRDTNVSFVGREWKRETVVFAFGGGDVTAEVDDAGTFRFDPAEGLDERAMLLNWRDGDRAYRLAIPRGIVTSGIETTFFRTGPSDLPITFTALATEGVKPFTLYSNDPAMAVA